MGFLVIFYQGVNQPLYESEKVERCNADQLIIDLGLDASDLLNGSPATSGGKPGKVV